MIRATITASLLTLAGCSVGPRAQVLVTIDAEDRVDAASDSVLVRMWGRAVDGQFDDGAYLEEVGHRYPWTVALAPQSDDPTRIFRFEATAYAGDTANARDPEARQFVAQARLISGYERGQILHVYLLLQNACIGVPCEQLSESCRDGRCEEIPEDPVIFDPDAGFPDAGVPACSGAPGTPEDCNYEDDDCDGSIDEDFDFLTELTNCGGCGMDCSRANATETCARGVCTMECDTGFADCNGRADDGCETDLLDPAHCGGCGEACPASAPLCQLGGDGPECVATCAGGLTDCGGSCVDTATSTEHCRGCGMACAPRPHASASCGPTGCVYTCDDGFDSCNGAPGETDGCETDLSTVLDCRACGTRCTTTEPCRTPRCGATGCEVTLAAEGESCDADPDDCKAYACRADGVCAPTNVLDGTGCDNGDGCPGDTCHGGECRSVASCSDAGRPDAGPPDAGPSDAGFCDAGACGVGESCCGGNVCCGDDGVTSQCCGYQCCDLSTEFCMHGTCFPRDAGVDAGRDAGRDAGCDGGVMGDGAVRPCVGVMGV